MGVIHMNNLLQQWYDWAETRRTQGFEVSDTFSCFDLWLSQNHPEVQDQSKAIWDEQ
jgi:hypothetical protein